MLGRFVAFIVGSAAIAAFTFVSGFIGQSLPAEFEWVGLVIFFALSLSLIGWAAWKVIEGRLILAGMID